MFSKILVTTLFMSFITLSYAKPIQDTDVRILHQVLTCKYALNVWEHDISSEEKRTVLVNTLHNDDKHAILELITKMTSLYNTLSTKLSIELSTEDYSHIDIKLIMSGENINFEEIDGQLVDNLTYSNELLVSCSKILD